MKQSWQSLFAMLIVLGAGPCFRPASAGEGRASKDLFGVALPKGAVSRIGSDRFRVRATTSALCFSPDSKRLAWANWPGPVRIWEFGSTRAPSEIDVPGNKIMALRFDRVGAGLLVGARSRRPEAFSCRRVSGTQWLVFEAKVAAMPMAAAFSPDGKTAAAVLANGELLFWEVATGKQRRRAIGATTVGDRMAFSSDGSVVGIRGYGNHAVDEFWDVAACRKLKDAGGRTFAFDYGAVSPDKTLRVSVRGGKLDARSADGSTRPAFWTGLQPGRAVLSPDGKYLAVSVGAYMLGNMTVWNVATGRRVSARHTGDVRRAAISPDGKTLATSSDDMTVRAWDIRTGKQRWVSREKVPKSWQLPVKRAPAVAFAPDGKTLAVAKGNCIRFLDPANGAEQRRLAVPDGTALWLAFAPDGETFALVAREPGRVEIDIIVHDHSIRVCRTDSGKQVWRHKAKWLRVHSLAFCSGGKALVGLTGRGGKYIRTWNAASGAAIRTIDVSGGMTNPRTTAWAVGPKGRRVATASSRKLHLWDLRTGKQLGVIDAVGNYMEALSFSPDGKYLAAGGQWSTPGDPAEFWLFDLKSRTVAWRTDAHRGHVLCVAFSPDGRLLVTGSQDGSALVWPMPPRPSAKAPASSRKQGAVTPHSPL